MFPKLRKVGQRILEGEPTFSMSKFLREDGKSNPRFERDLELLTLEELIALKLEVTARSAGYYLFGWPLYRMVKDVVKQAIFYYALSAGKTDKETVACLGVNIQNYYNDMKELYRIKREMNRNG